MQTEMSPGTSAAVLSTTFIYLAQISKGKIELFQGARWALSLRCWQFSFLNCFTNECGCLGTNFHFYSVYESSLSGYSCLTKEATAWSWPQLIQKKAEGCKDLAGEHLGRAAASPASLACVHWVRFPGFRGSPFIILIITTTTITTIPKTAPKAATIGGRWAGLYFALLNMNIITTSQVHYSAFVNGSDSWVQRTSTGI